jgi:hypothetical protein
MELRPCECGCKELIPIINKRNEISKYKHGHNRRGKMSPNSIHKGSDHGMWKGGKWLDPRGYVLIKANHPFSNVRGYVYEHRLVWEEYNNAMILPWIEVHHINEIKNDNRIENLQLITKSNHARGHQLGVFN